MDVVGSGDATMRAVGFADGGAAARLATVTAVRPWVPKRVNTADSVLAHMCFHQSSDLPQSRGRRGRTSLNDLLCQ